MSEESNVKAEISKVEPDISKIEPELSNVESDISKIEPEQSKVDPELSKVEAEVVKVESAVSKLKSKYSVITVEKTETPDGLTGDNWYRYVIGEGGSKIEGKKPGSLKGVTEHAHTAAEELNNRAVQGRSTYAPTKRPPPKK
jgi:predicted nuclease with TOPRIM domain